MFNINNEIINVNAFRREPRLIILWKDMMLSHILGHWQQLYFPRPDSGRAWKLPRSPSGPPRRGAGLQQLGLGHLQVHRWHLGEVKDQQLGLLRHQPGRGKRPLDGRDGLVAQPLAPHAAQCAHAICRGQIQGPAFARYFNCRCSACSKTSWTAAVKYIGQCCTRLFDGAQGG